MSKCCVASCGGNELEVDRGFDLVAVRVPILHAVERVRESNAQHHCQANGLWSGSEVANMATEETKVALESTLTCPSCGHVETETMPTDTCQWFHECTSCKTVLKPLEGDCCVHCSYATVLCPPIQVGKSCCA